MKKAFNSANLGPVLRALTREPLTYQQLATKTGLGTDTSRSLCRSLHQSKLVYIHHWEPHNHSYQPAYHFGEGQDQPFKNRMPFTQVRILECFKSPTTHLGLAFLTQKLNLTENTLARHLAKLEKKHIVLSSNHQNTHRKKTWRINPQHFQPKLNQPTQPIRPKNNTTPQTWFSVLGIKDHAP